MKSIFIFILKFILNYMFFWLEPEIGDERERPNEREEGRDRERVGTCAEGILEIFIVIITFYLI